MQNGWREYITASGRLYYYHKASKTTQWKQPVEVVAEAVPSNTLVAGVVPAVSCLVDNKRRYTEEGLAGQK